MTAYNLKSAHPKRNIKVDVFTDGEPQNRIPLRISDGPDSVALYFKPEEITERGAEVASILDSALDCYIARKSTPSNAESPEDSSDSPLLVGLSLPDAPKRPRAPSPRRKQRATDKPRRPKA